MAYNSKFTGAQIDALLDASEAMQTSKEDVANKVTSLDADADDVHYPSAKAVKDAVVELNFDTHILKFNPQNNVLTKLRLYSPFVVKGRKYRFTILNPGWDISGVTSVDGGFGIGYVPKGKTEANYVSLVGVRVPNLSTDLKSSYEVGIADDWEFLNVEIRCSEMVYVLCEDITNIINLRQNIFDTYPATYEQGSIYLGKEQPSTTTCIYNPIYYINRGNYIWLRNKKDTDGSYWKVRVALYDANKKWVRDAYGFAFNDGDYPLNFTEPYFRYSLSLISAEGADLACTPSDYVTNLVQFIGNGLRLDLMNNDFATQEKLTDLARKVGNISGVYEFDYSKGDHSSNKDRFDCNIEQGETFSLEVLLSTSIVESVATYVKYEGDNNTTLLASFPVNTKKVFTAARKIVSIGVYFNASDSGAAIVHFTSNENLQGKASTQFVDGLKKEIDSDIEVLQKKDLFLETKIGAYRDDIVNNGNGSDWVYFTFNDLYPECTYKLTFTGNITDASGEGQAAFAQCTVLLKDGTSKTVFNIGKGGTFASGTSYILNGITRLSANFRYQSNEELSASLESVSDAVILAEEAKASIAEISDLLDVVPVQSSTSAAISVGTIYLGNTNNSVDCLADNIYYEIKPNSTIKLICAEKIRVRVSEYDSSKKYIKDSGAYTKITEYTTGDATCFVRISATYADRGYNSSNPISVGVFSPDDFGFIFTKSNVINTLKEENTELGITKQDKIIGSINQYNYKTAVKGQLTASGFQSNADVYVSDYIYCKGQSKVSANYAGRTGLYVYFYDAELNVVDRKLQHQNYTWDIPANAVFLRINMSYYNTTGMVVFGEAEEAQTYVPYRDVSYIFDTLEQHGQKIAEMSGEEGSVESFNKDKESAILAIRNAAPNKYAVANKGLYPVFGVITDIHDDWTRMRRALDYCEKKNADALLVLGDIGDNQAALDAFDWQGFVLNSSIPILAIPGNHEFVYNAGQTSYVGYTDETLAAKLYNSELVSHNGEIHPSGKNYWYKDIQKSVRGVDYKLRIIGIYQHEFVDTWTDGHPDHTQNSGLAKDDVYYKQAQIDWLVNLLDNTDENTHVVLLVHWAVTNNLSRVESAWTPSDKVGVGITSGVTHGSNNDMIPMIVNAWINGTNVNTSSTMRTDGSTISVNHTFGASHHGKFVGYFSGHTHHDAITKVAEMDEQFNYAFNCTTNNDSQQSGDTPRSADGKCQDSFSLVGYDFLKNRVSLVKIGSDVTVDMKDRKYACNFNS